MKNKVQIAFVRGRRPRARLIQFGMFLFQILQMRKYPIKSPSHTDLILNGLVVGAQARGIVATSINHAYKKNPEIELIDIPVTDEEFDKLYQFCLQTLGTPYEFFNFLNHPKRIFGGKGKWDKDKYYCIEHTAEAMNVIRPGFCPDAYKVNPIEFYKVVKEKI